MKREPVELLSIKVKCPSTGKSFSVPAKTLSFRGWSQECETCGSHGGVDMDIGKCPECGKTHPVTTLQSF